MKRFIVVMVLVGALTALLASTVLAAGPGYGMHTPSTGLAANGSAGYGPSGGRGMGQRGGAPEWAGQPEEVEKLLGMTDEQIRTERLAGKSLAQIGQTKGVTQDTLTSTILSAKKADLDKLVADGKLTQAQADYAYSRMQQQVPAMIARTTTGPAQAGNAAEQGSMGQRRGGRWTNR
jgi:hypothetical protein